MSPLLIPPQKPDPLVEIRQQELQNDTAEIQRKAQNDAMDFQIDQAKLEQSAQLAMQRMQVQQGIADDRNDVNIYRINTQAALKRSIMLQALIGPISSLAGTWLNGKVEEKGSSGYESSHRSR